MDYIFHFSLSVCLSVCLSLSLCLCVCVCVCVCVYPSVNKMPIERTHRFERGIRLTVAYSFCSDPIEIGDLGFKVKITVTEYVN